MATNWMREEFPHLTCGMCKWFKVNADREPSICKRLDHKHIKFAKPYFKSYDCGQFRGNVCSDFEPAAWCKKLCEMWTSIDDYMSRDESAKYNDWLVLDDDFSVWYEVRHEDFFNNTFIGEDGKLKWVDKMYYVQKRSSPTGYELVHEINKGEE